MRTSPGLTLIELVVTLAIFAILLGIALVFLPNDHVAVNQAANGFARQFARARLEALKNDTFAGITVATTGDGSYQVCVDQNANRQCDPGEAIQSVVMGQGNDSKVRITSAAFSQFLFDPRGIPITSPAGAVTFSNPSGSYTVTVQVTTTGEATVQ
jgi:type IV fimbrial biogenesis protein FimT